MSSFRARRSARIKAYFFRPAFLTALIVLVPSVGTPQFGAPGMAGMLGGFMYGAGGLWGPKMYMSGMGATPWYSEVNLRPMMGMGCGYWTYCGGFPFPYPRQTVVRTRSCTKLVCERVPGGGIEPPSYDAPVTIADPAPKPKPREYTPPVAPPRPPREELDIGEIPVIESETPPMIVQFPPLPSEPPPERPPDPKPPEVVTPPRNEQEGGFIEATPSRRCEARRQAYKDRVQKRNTEGKACTDPSSPDCQAAAKAGVLKLVGAAAIESSAASGAQSVIAQIYQDCRVLDIDNVICAGGDFAKKKGVNTGTITEGYKNGSPYLVREGEFSNEYRQEICDDPANRARAPNCQLACTHPTAFNWGGKPSLIISGNGELTLDVDRAGAGGENTVMVNGVKKKSDRGHDCTGAISAFFLADGRLMKPVSSLGQLRLENTVPAAKGAQNQRGPIGYGDNQVHHMSPRNLIVAGEKEDTCFTTVRLEKDKPLLPGDVISKSTHSMMIERLDQGWESDPFGMGCWGQALDEKGDCANRAATEEQLNKIDCKQAHARYFRFDLIQSAGMDSKGYVRTPAYDFFSTTCKNDEKSRCIPEGGADLETGVALEELAVSYCEARKSGARAPKAFGGVKETTVGIVRHNEKKPGCMVPGGKKPKLKNDECVGDCKSMMVGAQ